MKSYWQWFQSFLPSYDFVVSPGSAVIMLPEVINDIDEYSVIIPEIVNETMKQIDNKLE